MPSPDSLARPHSGSLISCNVDDNDEDTLGVPPSFKFAPLFDKIMGNGDLLARLAGVNDLSLSNCEVN